MQGQEQLLAQTVKEQPVVVMGLQAAEPLFTAAIGLADLIELLIATTSLSLLKL